MSSHRLISGGVAKDVHAKICQQLTAATTEVHRLEIEVSRLKSVAEVAQEQAHAMLVGYFLDIL